MHQAGGIVEQQIDHPCAYGFTCIYNSKKGQSQRIVDGKDHLDGSLSTVFATIRSETGKNEHPISSTTSTNLQQPQARVKRLTCVTKSYSGARMSARSTGGTTLVRPIGLSVTPGSYDGDPLGKVPVDDACRLAASRAARHRAWCRKCVVLELWI